jgi:hypothetical protein
LTGLHDGQPKVFRDSAVENLREFFGRFRRLNIRSSPDLDELVQQAVQVSYWHPVRRWAVGNRR